MDCDVENQYINIGADEAVVTWKEPRFVDNAGLLGKPTVNIDNGLRRRAQVYFVGYTARDTSGNVATCKFFVHVNGMLVFKFVSDVIWIQSLVMRTMVSSPESKFGYFLHSSPLI